MRRHDEIFNAINAVTDAGAASRQQAATVMREHLQEEGVIQFLLKSFVDGQWRFNVPVLWDQYPHIGLANGSCRLIQPCSSGRPPLRHR